ncbi:UNVERIFIED_CONTAM: WUSCHEL-related homeobox 11 [Sesamum radiatum]|uniref:Protein WUSCHEL n=1 Tax=Sesamum radiatum TaxID=300843 RepID=A0AAW2NRP2_SESRA
MEDQARVDTRSRPSHGGEHPDQRTEPVRSRWTPKPEQILILESIFNSGMVNPPKDETVRIRKLLEKFGSVGDANVFYWFQNRRSRSRRRQRQIQASLSGGDQSQAPPRGGGCTGGGIQYANIVATTGGFAPNPGENYPVMNASPGCLVGSSSSCGFGGNGGNSSDDLFPFSGQTTGLSVQEYEQTPIFCSPDASSLHYQPDVITVFINGVATEVGRGPVDMRAMCGGDFVLFHASGVPVEVNEYGFLMQSLQHGESYFLV